MSLLQMSFSGAVLILAIIIVRAVAINKLPKKMFLFLWGITLVRLLIPFSVPSPASVYSLVNLNTSEETLLGNMLPIIPEEQMESLDEAGLMESTGEAEQAQVQQHAEPTPYFSGWQIVGCLGAVLFTAFFTIFYLCWLSRFRTAQLVHNRNVEQWMEEHRLKRPVSIRQSDRIDTPLTYGIFHPVILMPKDTNWEDTPHLRYILQHEYIHICRLDTVTKLVCALAVCIHWFNPLVWVMYLLFNRDLELSCDERVVRRFGIESRKTYARMLISMEAKKSGLMPFYNSFSKNAIEERITSIMKIKKTSIFAILIAIVLIGGITVACATSATKSEDNKISQDAQNAPDNDSESDERVQHRGNENSDNANINESEIMAYITDWNDDNVSIDVVEWVQVPSSRADELGITDEDGPGGFYIYNATTMIQRFTISEDCMITILDWQNNYRPQTVSTEKFITILQERGEQNLTIPYSFEITYDEITKISEQYIP